MPPQVWYDITITDDGKIIKVFVAAPHIPLEHSQKPILEFETQHLETKHHIAFFNREPLAGASFESWLDDIVIHRLKPGK